MRWRRSSKRDAAPEKVKAMSSPSNANKAASAAAAPFDKPSGSRARRAIPIRRPSSEKTSMPTNRPPIDSNAMVSRFILTLRLLFLSLLCCHFELRQLRFDPIAGYLELSDRDRQFKPPRAGAAWVHIEDATPLFDCRLVRMPGHHDPVS